MLGWHLALQGYYHDDGPPALDQIVETCRIIHEKLEAQSDEEKQASS